MKTNPVRAVDPTAAVNTRWMILLGAWLLLGCSDDGPVATEDDADATGVLEVVTSTTGEDIDPDGYLVSIDDGPGEAIDVDANLTIAGLSLGEHQIGLTGLATPCAVAGENPVTVTVLADGVAEVVFNVVCQLALRNQIVFWSDREGNSDVYVINADGSGLVSLTQHPSPDEEPAVSPDGARILFVRNGEIHVMNANGSGLENLTNHPAVDFRPRWSPDGTRIAFTSARTGEFEIFVMDADGSNPTNLTNEPGANDNAATWSPDGSRIAFTSGRTGDFEIFMMDADGSNSTNLTNDPTRSDFAPAWSPDGTRIAFTSNPGFVVGTGGNDEIFVMDVDGSNPINLTTDDADDFWPSWSPDGARIAFTSDRAGDLEVFVMNADGSEPANLSNSPSNDLPGFPQAWSP